MSYKMTTAELVRRAKKVHGEQYDFSQVMYVNSKTKVKIICREHGEFYKYPYYMYNVTKTLCPKCSRGNRRKTSAQFIADAVDIHGNRYDYSKTKYINISTKVTITCREHGDFVQYPGNHLKGHHCGLCTNGTSRTTEQFVQLCQAKHPGKYTYQHTEYINCSSIVSVGCASCGITFSRTADNLLNKSYGCPQCNKSRKSVLETKWLDTIQADIVRQHPIQINSKKMVVDGFDPNTNTVYEFHGDYWHGNPAVYDPSDVNQNNKKTFGELYNETLHKHKLLKDHGYNVVEMWENDFKDKNV